MKVHEYNEMMAYMLRPRQKFAIGGGVIEGEDLGSREGYAKARYNDPENNIKKGQELGEGIQQKLKYVNKEGKNVFRYATSSVRDTVLKEHLTPKDAKAYRKQLIQKYNIGEVPEYKGKYNYQELIKDPDFERFWKARVDGTSVSEITGLQGKKKFEEGLDKIIKKYKLKPNDYEGIFNKFVEETRISEAIRKGTKTAKGKEKLISGAFMDNLIETFNKSYKPNVGTLSTAQMEKLLKLPEGDLSRIMASIDKPVPPEKLRFAKTDTISRIRKAAVLKDKLDAAGITYEKFERTPGKGGKDYRFRLDPDKNVAAQKFIQLQNDKDFGFEQKAPTQPQRVKQAIATLSKQSDEYKKYGYGRDRNTIDNLTTALNNSLRSMNDKELYNFINENPKIKNLVTSVFDARTGEIKNVSLDSLSPEQIRNSAQFEVDHIRGRATVDYDPATKKILDGLDIEYPKNLYIIPKAVNGGVKKAVENYVANFPNETKKIKKINKYFTDNKLTYYNRNTNSYAGYKPSKSAVDLAHLGITKVKELKNLITGTYLDSEGVERVKTNDPEKLVATINELQESRGAPKLSGKFAIPVGIITGLMTMDNEVEAAEPGETAEKEGFTNTEKLLAGTTAGAAYAARKPILKTLSAVSRPLGFPSVSAGFSLSNILDYEKPEDASILDRLNPMNYEIQDDPDLKMAGADLLLPEFIKSAAPRGSGILSMLGRVAMNPFGRAARFFTPAGIAIGTAGIAKDYYDFARDEIEKVRAMSPEERQAYNESLMDEGGMIDISREGFADGSPPDDPSKRKFMKIMGGLASLPIVGRFFDVAQMVEKAAPVVKETAANVPPYFFKLVDKIKQFGKDETSLLKGSEREQVTVYRTSDADYELYEDLNTGSQQIKIRKGDPDVGYKEQELTLTKGQSDESAGVVPDDYDEYTIRPDSDGKLKDIDEGLEDIDDLIDELGPENISIKELQDMGYDVDRLGPVTKKKLGIK